MAKRRIVIIGAGFGGLATARALDGADAEIVLIDRANHHLFQPLLYQVATAALSPADIATATRALIGRQANLTILMAEATGIDTATRRVRLADTAEVPYDDLVLATGAAYSYFGHDDWAGHSLSLKTLEDAAALRSRLLGVFEWAESRTDPEEIRRLLTFVVVGGGPTGVELAGNVAELARSTFAREFRRIDPRSARILLCESGPGLLAAFPARLGRYAERALASLGVELLLGRAVTAIDANGIVAGGERIEAASVLWAAGTAARPAAAWLGVTPAQHGTIAVGADCAVPGHPGIYAIGDGASQLGSTGQPLPGLAAVAKQQGHYVGRLLRARLDGKPPPAPFRYHDYGMLAVVGRYRAVATLPLFSLAGPPAWLLWSLVHLVLLMDFRSRTAVWLNWCWSWLSQSRGDRLVSDAPKFEREAAGRERRAAVLTRQ
jgi:NADH dehydrogenase